MGAADCVGLDEESCWHSVNVKASPAILDCHCRIEENVALLAHISVVDYCLTILLAEV